MDFTDHNMVFAASAPSISTAIGNKHRSASSWCDIESDCAIPAHRIGTLSIRPDELQAHVNIRAFGQPDRIPVRSADDLIQAQSFHAKRAMKELDYNETLIERAAKILQDKRKIVFIDIVRSNQCI